MFGIAEEKLGIPSLLDPCDMAECDSPDRLSILTYLSEFYHKFKSEKSPTGSPQTFNKKKPESPAKVVNVSNNLNISKPCPDLKRKDSCDSGVSVSPLGSVCNSPPGQRKDSSISTPPVTPASKLEVKHDLKSDTIQAPVTLVETKTVLDSKTISPTNYTPTRTHESTSTGLENILRQRLKISLDSPKSPVNDTSQNERSSLLQSMISSPSPDTSITTSGSRKLTEQSVSSDLKCSDVTVPKSSRRHTLDTLATVVTRSNDESSAGQQQPGPGRGRVSQLSQSFANSCPSSKFVSKTTISLTPNNPIKYAANNSVTCDIKTNSSPKPWKDYMHQTAAPFCSTPKKSVSASHLLQVGSCRTAAVKPAAESLPTNRIVIHPSFSPAAPDLKSPLSSSTNSKLQQHSSYSETGLNSSKLSRHEPGEDLNCNLKNVSDNSFKSRMMKFEQLINPVKNEAVKPRLNVSHERVKPGLSARDDNHYPVGEDAARHERRKTISFPASFAFSSISDNQDSRLTF